MAIRVFGFWLLLLSTTLAQTPPSVGTGSISGTITNYTGRAIIGQWVRLERLDENEPPSTNY